MALSAHRSQALRTRGCSGLASPALCPSSPLSQLHTTRHRLPLLTLSSRMRNVGPSIPLPWSLELLPFTTKCKCQPDVPRGLSAPLQRCPYRRVPRMPLCHACRCYPLPYPVETSVPSCHISLACSGLFMCSSPPVSALTNLEALSRDFMMQKSRCAINTGSLSVV